MKWLYKKIELVINYVAMFWLAWTIASVIALKLGVL